MDPGQTATHASDGEQQAGTPGRPAARPPGDADPSGQTEAAVEALEIGVYCVDREGR